MNSVILYGKPGCHLCDEAYELVLSLQGDCELNIIKSDVTLDAALMSEYGERIPVLVVNNKMVLTAPIRPEEVRRALKVVGA